LKKILLNFKGCYKEIVLGPLFKLLEAVLELFVPIVMANIIDIGIQNGDTDYVIQHGLLLLALAAAGMGMAMICQYYAIVVSGRFGRRLRRQVYGHVMSLSGADISKAEAPRLITLLTNDIGHIQTGVNMAIRLATRAPFLAVGSIVMAITLNWQVGMIFLVSTPLIIAILYFIMKSTLPDYGRVQAGQDTLSQLAGENLSGVRVIRAFGRQKQEAAAMEDASNRLTALTVRVGKISMALNPLTAFVVNIAIVGIIWLGAQLASSGQLVSGEIIALVSYMTQTLLALIVIANITVLFTRAIASARRVAEILNIEPSIAETEDAAAVGLIVETDEIIRFDRVSFAYHAGAGDALEDISFRIAPGQTIGMIGGTGSGKSTIVNLIMRQFDIERGNIYIGEMDIKDVPPQLLRGMIGLVPQKAALFSGTVRYNLQMSAPNASDDQLRHALEAAQAADFVSKMPHGLDTVLEENGKNLSGGQRQRLTIARALVRRPHILILDDSTSALDYATEAALRAALVREKVQNPNMTMLIISQRAASLRSADMILVLDDGRLTGCGTHAELLENNTIYREICNSQENL